jgi:translocation protein SEC63
LIEAMVELTVSRRWLLTTLSVIDFSQHLVQGLWAGDNNLMQLPHIGDAELKMITGRKDAPKNIRAFLDMEGAASKAFKNAKDSSVVTVKSCLTDMDSKKRDEIWAAVKAIPDVSMEVSIFVEDEEEIAEGDLVTIKVTITHKNLEEGEKIPPVYAPNFPGTREEGWWVLLASTRNKQVLSYGHEVAKGRVLVKELKLMAPNKPSTVQLELYVKSDSYIGLDQKHEVKFNVVSSANLPAYVPHPDDLELDNEPTLFEQVMHGYDDSDSEDEGKKGSADKDKSTASEANGNTEAKSAKNGVHSDDDSDEY